MTDFMAVALTGFANGLGTFTALEVFSYIKKHDLLARPSNIFDAILTPLKKASRSNENHRFSSSMADIKNKIEKRGRDGKG